MTDNINKWYIRKAGEISGPFSKQVIANNLKLGRLSANDELSADKISWTIIHLAEQLFNEQLSSTNTLSLDERDGFDRRQSETNQHSKAFEARRQQDRRTPESYTQILRRQLRTELLTKYRESAHYSKLPFFSLLFVVVFIALLAIVFPTKIPSPSANCNATASPHVDWSNCSKLHIDLTSQNLTQAQLSNSQLFSAKLMNINLESANLAYADLRLSDLSYSYLAKTNFLGSNLQNVDLSYADLTEADLSFANLAGAKIGGAQLQGASLANTIWINGQTCSANSVGECILEDN